MKHDEQMTAADAQAEAIFGSVNGYISKEFARQFESAMAPILKRLEELKQGLDGKDGPAGADGKDGAPGVDGANGLDGAAGKDGEPGPAGRDGSDGKDGEPGLAGKDGSDGLDGMPGAQGEPGRDGRDGKNGAPGRDAADLEVLDGIDDRKSYARGTFATHKGGLWRAADTTDGMDGWVCVTRGVDHESEVIEDSGRVIKRKTVYSDGQVYEREIKTAVMVYRGIYTEEKSFETGDTVTWGGSLWHCEEPTGDKPGEGSKAWRLAVKKGSPGKDAVRKD